MAKNENQNEFFIPVSIEDQEKRKTARHLPRFFRTDSNKKFLGGTLDPLTNPGKLVRINAYVGRRDVVNYNFDDNYIVENSTPRQYYQLETAFVNENKVTGEVNWFGDYIDYINQLRYFGANVSNHSKLNKQESYAWDPHIDWDKLVNYREYYWLPNGPDHITIYGDLESTESTFTVKASDQGDNVAYMFTPDGLTANPRITLYRGIKYRFEIDAPGKFFSIKTQPTADDRFFYNIGVSSQRIEKGVLEFEVAYEAPDLLYYIDNKNNETAGIIDIKDIEENTFLDIEKDILGKKVFKSSTGIDFINGMKLKFVGNVSPKQYSKDFWYVEGVGKEIKLVNYRDLEAPAIASSSLDLPFDDQPFDSYPWDNADNFPSVKDYITINRASSDRNTWSRNNRWFHRNVLETTALANNQVPNLDQNSRALRPIIEFEPNLKLYNHGYIGKKDVDLVDTFTTDVFSKVEGSIGYSVDGEFLQPGYRVLFTADPDILVNGRIFEVKFIFNANENRKQITLIDVDDTEPLEGENVYVSKGNSYKGSSLNYKNGVWNFSQKKNATNQAPLFDLFDENLNSFADTSVYSYSTFNGNRLFGYKIGTGVVDSELNFAVSYRNIENIGDIEFEFDLENSIWTYVNQNELTEINSYVGFLQRYENGIKSYVNGWLETDRASEQNIIRILRIETPTNVIPIDVYENSGSISDLRIRIYVNDIKRTDVSIQNIDDKLFVVFNDDLSVGDKVIYKVRSVANKNQIGYYEIPLNWQNNPTNESLNSFTFGETVDHARTIVENVAQFSGNFPGASNLANVGPITQFGRKFMQHSGPMSLSSFFMIDKDANAVKSLRWTARKYTEFKKEFLRLAQTLGADGTVSDIVDQILLKYSETKNIDSASFYFSDMAPYGAASIREYEVLDPRLPVFVIDSIYNPFSKTKRSILVYLNNQQLLHGKDYHFDTEDAFIIIDTDVSIGDKIQIRDYSSTDGCYIPVTPSKLGLYPSYIPMMYEDDTLVTPTKVIQGHDGSITVAYLDYRDDLILELEKRIYNTRRVDYDPKIFNIHDVLNGYYRRGEFTKTEINDVLIVDFLKWNSIPNLNFNSNDYFINEESFTYNYNRAIAPNLSESLQGYWRGIYRYFYDTDRPHSHPWEIQGFTIKPKWWDDVYGPAPYTSNNRILWDNIEQGIISDPIEPRIDLRYARPGIVNYLPVDDAGNLLSPLDSDLAQEFSLANGQGRYNFGDGAPAENAWRRSSEYPFAISVAMCVLRGSEYIGKMWDRFTIKRNIAGQMYDSSVGKRISPSTLSFPDVKNPDGTFSMTCGLANIIDEYVGSEKYVNLDYYKNLIKEITPKLRYRIGGFTSKEKIKVLLDSRSPNASGTIFLPQENYKIFYNKSAPVDTINYSGIVIEKLGSSYKQWQNNKRYQLNEKIIWQKTIYRCLVNHVSGEEFDLDNWIKEGEERFGYSIRGYDNERNYFEVFPPRPNKTDPTFNVGGISESFVDWSSGKYYPKSQLVRVDTLYYRAKVGHTSSGSFAADVDKWAPLSTIPIVGGAEAYKRRNFSSISVKIPYGTVFADIQSVVDFMLGYQERLKSWGFVFDDWNKDLNVPLSWDTSVKEFMFWTLQNWATGAVITLSPAASGLTFSPKINASVDNLDTDFYEYSIFKADGTPLKTNMVNVYREDSGFVLKPSVETTDGIYHIRTNLVYKEHVLLLDNESIFNDVVYDVIPGYRQGRVKILGFKTNNWDGGFTSPGFLYDEAKINDWQPNVDYNLGDIVRYKNYYFSATVKVLGKNDFDYNDWKQLENVPTPKIIPNFDYKVEQFRDFYELESSNYDTNQQALARHLIGYQPREYLDNIVVDDVSQYKFYQGFIKEKGTLNSVTKLFDALRASGFSAVDIREEWAIKVGDYGANDAFVEIEFPLDESKVVNNPQAVELTLNSTIVEDPSIYSVKAREVTLKPIDYNAKPFKTKVLDRTQTDFGIFKYKVAGYVRDKDVDHIIYSTTALLETDVNLFKEKDKIWVGFTENNDWDVYQFENTNITIQGWSSESSRLFFYCSDAPNIAVGDIVAVKNLDFVNKIYKVLKVYSNTFEVASPSLGIFKPKNVDDSSQGILIKLQSVRYSSIDALSSKRYTDIKIKGDRVWVDTDSSGNWLVLENKDAFTVDELLPTLTIEDELYGYSVKISLSGTYLYVGTPAHRSGKVFVYNRPNLVSRWALIQILAFPTSYSPISLTEQFGYSIDCSSNGEVVVISAPALSGLYDNFEGEFDPATSYTYGDIVRYDDKLWKNINPTVGDGTTFEYNLDWEQVYIYEGTSITGTTSGLVKQGAVFVFEYNQFISKYEVAHILGSYDPSANEKFGSKVKLAQENDDIWLFVSGKNYNNDLGRVSVFKATKIAGIWNWKFNDQRYIDFSYTLGTYPSPHVPVSGSQYGYDIDCTTGAYRVVVSAPYMEAGAVYVFTRSANTFVLAQMIDVYTIAQGITPNNIGESSYLTYGDQFGFSVNVTRDFLLIACPNDDLGGYNLGSVYFFDSVSDESTADLYRLKQIIVPPSKIDNERFGTCISINPKTDVIAISSSGGNSLLQTTFDSFNDRRTFNDDSTRNYILDDESHEIVSTTFDNDSTMFFDAVPYTGAVYIYNKFEDTFIFGDKLKPLSQLTINSNFGYSLSSINGTIAVGATGRYTSTAKTGTVLIFDYDSLSWDTIESQNSLVDISKFKKAIFYNTEENKLIANLDYFDPLKGRIPGIAAQEIKYQTYYDPAVYEFSDDDTKTVDASSQWTDEHVGDLWWDLSTVKYVWYEQGDTGYRNINWGRLFPGASIDIYEWVESPYLPSRWDSIADKSEGLALGISGKPKDITDTTYSSKFKYDPITNSSITLYYYWVKNKVVVPNVMNRKISAYDVALLIENPRSQGYRYIAITGENSLSLNNMNSNLIDKNVSINLQFYVIDNAELLTHREYALIANDDASAIIPNVIESKWFDSLIGFTTKGQRVPDPRLNSKQKYGISNNPRQSMFVNRIEALKQLFEYVNSILIQQQIVDQVNLTKLSSKDISPKLDSGDVDFIVDFYEDLNYLGTSKISPASLTLGINDGKIINVIIDKPGYGYGKNKVFSRNENGEAISWYGPNVKILGTGTGAVIQTVVNNLGKIISASIIKAGTGYDSTTKATVRNYTVLVTLDSAVGGWSLNEWDEIRKRWYRVKTQAYDVTKYWGYTDWYASGYGIESDISYLIENTKDLNGLPVAVGEIVKISNAGYGNWLLLQRVNVTDSLDFTDDYIVIGKQNATIKFSSKLYNLNKDIGFDTKFSYDYNLYDQLPAEEIRIILETLRDDILINDLRIEYIRTFFNSIYYALTEQVYVDWIYKTSFLKVQHSVGTLKQRPTFQSDVLESYQSFIEEAKPYKSKIREFVSSYNATEYSDQVISDFDLPPYFDSTTKTIRRIEPNSSKLNSYPWKNWVENHTYELVDIIIKNPGSRYTSRPKVIISGGGLDLTNPNHRPAKATAYIATEKVYQIIIDDPGFGYISAPTIYISGGNGDIEENRAIAYGKIGRTKARTNFIGIKYDRYSFSYSVDDFTFTDTFTGTGSKKLFKLTYAPELEKNKFVITVNNIEIYSAQFEVLIEKVSHDTYSALEGTIKFREAPAIDSHIVITYYKNINLYGAADRINYAYSPTTGQYGKELGLLMNGVDYGGVQLTSIDFDIGSGWDIIAWDVSSWDTVITSDDDYVVESDGVTRTFVLPYIPADQEIINIYVNNVRIDDPYYSVYDGSTEQLNGRTSAPENAQMDSFVGDNNSNEITIPIEVMLEAGDQIIFRKSTSDGTILPQDRSLIDSLITGGDLAYSTARGIAADEIAIDGDGFVTKDTSHGPEELVQGQVVDSLNIKVYTTPSSGGPNVVVRNYVGDGITQDFSAGEIISNAGGLIVIVDSINLNYTDDSSSDYTIDFKTGVVTLKNIPAIGDNIAIISIDTAGYDIADKAVFIGDGSTKEFLTAARYNNGNVSGFVTINGLATGFNIKESTGVYAYSNNVVVEFNTAPALDDIVQIIIFTGTIKKWSEVVTQFIPIVPMQFAYQLSPVPAVIGPLSAMLFVSVDNEFLRAPDLQYYTYNGTNELDIGDRQYSYNTLVIDDINVYKNGVILTPVGDYTFDSTINTIVLNDNVAAEGDEIIIEILKKADFYISSDKSFETFTYNPAVHLNATFQISTDYALNSLTIENLTVSRNGNKLVPVTDYTFNSFLNRVTINESYMSDSTTSLVPGDQITIQISLTGNKLIISNVNYTVSGKSTIKVTTFSTHDILKIKTSNVGFNFDTGYDVGIFDTVKFDILNSSFNTSGIFDLPRTVTTKSGVFVALSRLLLTPNVDYVVLDNLRQIKVLLPNILTGSDYLEIITFNNETVKPSYGYMIFKDMINRYHYKRLDKTMLTSLKEPLTYLDTQITVYDGSALSEPSREMNIPGVIEINGERIEYLVKQDNVLRQLRRGTLGTAMSNFNPVGSTVRDIGITETIPYRDQENKKVFYGDGSTNLFELDFVPTAKEATINDDSTINTGWYRETIPYNYGQSDELEVFVSGKRLIKTPITVYDQALGQDSYNAAGDKTIEAEFAVDGITPMIRLTKAPEAGAVVVVVWKTGKLWQRIDENSSLVYSNSDQANFIISREVDLPK